MCLAKNWREVWGKMSRHAYRYMARSQCTWISQHYTWLLVTWGWQFLCRLDMYYMGWLRLVRSLKLYVSFAEYCLFHRALFAKETHNFKALGYRNANYTCLGGKQFVTGIHTGIHCIACSALLRYCRSFSTKEPLNIGLFCEKWPIKIGILSCRSFSMICIALLQGGEDS